MTIKIILLALFVSTSGWALAQEPADSAEQFASPVTDGPALSAVEIRDKWNAVVDEMASTGLETSANRLEDSINSLSDEDLLKIYGRADFDALIGVFRTSGKAMDAVDRTNFLEGKSLKEIVSSSDKEYSSTEAAATPGYTISSAGFPDATGYPGGICPASPDRTNANALIQAVHEIGDARLALEIAQGIWSPLSRACDEIIVVLGEGFNTSLACIPADIALFAAELVVGNSETTVEHAQYCNDAVNSAEIEGVYDRAGHLHTDLVTHDLEISNQLTQHDVDISNQLTQHDIDISNQLAQHDADIKALLGILQQTVEENQRLIKISMSRQLEVMKLLISVEGLREINPEVLTCTGDDCPQLIACPSGEYSWNKCEK